MCTVVLFSQHQNVLNNRPLKRRNFVASASDIHRPAKLFLAMVVGGGGASAGGGMSEHVRSKSVIANICAL